MTFLHPQCCPHNQVITYNLLLLTTLWSGRLCPLETRLSRIACNFITSFPSQHLLVVLLLLLVKSRLLNLAFRALHVPAHLSILIPCPHHYFHCILPWNLHCAAQNTLPPYPHQDWT